MGWFNSEFLHIIFNDVHIFESCVPILFLNALFKRLEKRLARRGRLKANGVADYMEPLHYKTHIYVGMFYIEVGVFLY